MKNGQINVLVAWPGSYIGRRLTRELLRHDSVHLRLIVKETQWVDEFGNHAVEIVESSTMNDNALMEALTGIDIAYFPLRFFGTDSEFGEISRAIAQRFLDACITARVKRIVYLGFPSRGNSGNDFIDTMEDVGQILCSAPDKIQTIWLRAGFIIGSGSVLFEVLHNLVQKCPLLIVPRWMEKKVSVIGIADLLAYLVQAKDLPVQETFMADIGPQSLSVREMLQVTSEVMGLKRFFVPLPVEARWLCSFGLMFTSPFSFAFSSFLIGILQKAEPVPLQGGQENAQHYFQDIAPLHLETVVEKAIAAIGNEQVVSRWTDSLAGSSCAYDEQDLSNSLFRDIKCKNFGDTPKQRIFQAFTSIGGRQGWFSFDILWRIRGVLDKLSGGFGTSLGRRVESELRVGDLLDVWKVIDLQEDRRLLLEAHMKVFGKAWLEFRIEGNTLIQTAYHYPSGLMGRVYWYSMLPFHVFIFNDMIESIIRRARTPD
ncbi:MAG TPA: SDR family oxidoreductase [Desulfuromonadales bacterium]|nr:SDR family oxidoreductase [Desulfuromonadales bacterium]